MDVIFPFGYPGPTAFYLTLYVLTMVVHVVFMNYVLAGSGYLAFASVFAGVRQRARGPVAMLLRDWMPFAISAAITAGVAPLLFVQILYKESFYTANLLLFHRWMAVVPALILGFYLIYLFKSRQISRWPISSRLLVGLVAFGCFVFVAYSWTENHLLSLQSVEAKATFYESARMYHFEPVLIPRLGVWFIGAVPTMCIMVAWQLWWKQASVGRAGDEPMHVAALTDHDASQSAPLNFATLARPLALVAMIGMSATLLLALWYALAMDGSLRAAAGSTLAMPFLIVAVAGLVMQYVAWTLTWRGGRLAVRPLALASAGCLLGILGATVVREALRLQALDVTRLYAQHEAATRVGGLIVFLVFTVINAGVVVWVFHLVRSGRVAPKSVIGDRKADGS